LVAVVRIAAMQARIVVITLTLAVALVGGYLYRATRDHGPASTAPASTAPTSATPAAAAQPVAPPIGQTARSLEAVAPTSPGTARRAAAPAPPEPPPVGVPGVRLDVRNRFDDAPGLADPTDRARRDLVEPPAPLAPESLEVLTSARSAFRAGDYAASRAAAREVLAVAPDSGAARRLAVSSSCRLKDAATARADAAALPPNERDAVVRYCAVAGVALDAPP
jgi:hypothetical protein